MVRPGKMTSTAPRFWRRCWTPSWQSRCRTPECAVLQGRCRSAPKPERLLRVPGLRAAGPLLSATPQRLEVLQWLIAPLLRSAGGKAKRRSPSSGHTTTSGIGDRPRRVIAKVEWSTRSRAIPSSGDSSSPTGSAGPRGSLPTTGRGTAEQWIKLRRRVRAELDQRLSPQGSWPTRVRLPLCSS